MKSYNRKRKTGAVNSKKKVIDGITFASSLEAYTYAKLKEVGIDFKYEGESFEVLPSFKFKGKYLSSSPKKKELIDKSNKVVRAITYTPDFVGDDWVIECKGFIPSNHSFPLRWKMFLKIAEKRGFDVYMPKNQKQVDEVIKSIQEKGWTLGI